MIGLCGPSGSGKTTLAQSFSDKNGIPFVKTNATSVFQRFSVSPSSDLFFEDRLVVQNAILDAFEEQYRSQPYGFVTDRTPIDVAAYTLADISRETIYDPKLEVEAMSLIERCFDIANRYFVSIINITGNFVSPDDTKDRPRSEAYNYHVQTICLGLLADKRCLFSPTIMSPDCTDLGLRVSALGAVTARFYETIMRQKELTGVSG
jgi:adenylate kinase family enzyme